MRTTLIVGFPGETERQYEKLVQFVEETEFDRLGVFTYSQEEGTQAAKLPNQISERIKKQRRDRIMKIQQKISARKNKEMVGREVEVLVDSPLAKPNGYTHLARTEGQALEIDGNVYLRANGNPVGSLVKAKIMQAKEYDLMAEAS